MAKRRQPRGVGQGLLRPTLRPDGVLALDHTIAGLIELDANGLCLQWRNHLGGRSRRNQPCDRATPRATLETKLCGQRLKA